MIAILPVKDTGYLVFVIEKPEVDYQTILNVELLSGLNISYRGRHIFQRDHTHIYENYSLNTFTLT